MVVLHGHASQAKELGRRQPGELGPVAAEVRLIEVAAVERDPRPFRRPVAVHQAERPLKPAEAKAGGTTTDPGYARVELGHDGTIRAVKFFGGVAPSDKVANAPARAGELAVANW